MQSTRLSPARKILAWLGAAVALVLLPGCETVTLTNLTPATMPENPSSIYTFTLRVTRRSNTVSQGGIAPHIIVDGRSYDLHRSSLGEGIYEFDYQLPASRDQVNYYFLVDYSIEGNSVSTPQQTYTDLQHLSIVHRYVLSLVVGRGPVGARISVVGRGFTSSDVIVVGDSPARTVYESPNALSFYVPALTPDRNYSVTLQSPAGNSPVGTFRIDPSNVRVLPDSLSLGSGQHQSLTFTIDNPAPAGGTLLDVTTDVPESVIMPEVIVPQGQTSVTVDVEGGKPGSGSLFLKGYGAGEVTIPVTVH